MSRVVQMAYDWLLADNLTYFNGVLNHAQNLQTLNGYISI